MVALLRPIDDPTLDAADLALVENAARDKPRPYLGMSSIGESCERKLWYRFRHAKRETFDAATLKRFDDGHRGEDIMIERLRHVRGLTLIDRDPDTGLQVACSDFGGHLRGHADGAILGILQAPKTWHVFEGKVVNERKFKKLQDLKRELGEKSALSAWDPVYYAQAVMYADYLDMTRHYLVCATPGVRDWTSVRTDANPVMAITLRAKAQRIIFNDDAPPRVGGPEFFDCRWCAFSDICHDGAWPDRGCRTCARSTAMADGTWQCERWAMILSNDMQDAGCPTHLYTPGMVDGTPVDAGDDFIEYRMADGTVWTDSENTHN